MPNLALLALEASDGTVVLTSITLVFAMWSPCASSLPWRAALRPEKQKTC